MAQRRRNPRGEGSRLREEIIVAATTALEQNGGEDAITLRGVARLAGVAAPSIYAHFADREAIVAAVVAQAFAELDDTLAAAVEGEADPRQRLWNLCEAYLDFAKDKPHRYRVAFGRHSITETPPGRLDDLSGGRAFTRLHDSVAACATESDATGAAPQIATTLLWVALHGYASLSSSVPAFPWPDRQEMLTALLGP